MVAPLQQSAHDYAAGVLSGDIPACRFIRIACERFRHDLETAEERGLFFDERAAAHAIAFIQLLRHSKGKWRKLPLILAGWQRFIVANLFGWKHRDTGFRRYTHAYIEVPRKNGKSTLLAAIGLYLFVADGENAPEVYTAATSLKQAGIVFGECSRMVRAAKPLKSRIAIYRGKLTIDNQDAILEALHAQSENLDGLNTHGAIVDEMHQHRNSETYDKLDTSTDSRDQAMIVIITTAGQSLECPCYRIRGEAINVLERTTTDQSLFVYIACIDDGDDWMAESTWFKANPNLGVSKGLHVMRKNLVKARNSAFEEAKFKRYSLDKWTNEETRWIPMDDWRACRKDPLLEEDLRGMKCYGGVDIAASKDTNAAAFFFPEILALFLRFYVPSDNMHLRERRDHVPFSQWVKDKWVCTTPGNITDLDFISDDIHRLSGIFDLQEMAYDPWNAMHLGTRLASKNITMVHFRQGFASMTLPCNEFEKFIFAHRLWHGANPVLQWMAGNVVVQTDAAGNKKPDKKASFERIDGIVASVMAIGRATIQPMEMPSVYEGRGVVVLG